MVVSNLVLFGKHPAWSDHMFLPNDVTAGHFLKRVFYDHSVIPALQGGQGDQRISENWSFLVFIDEQVFFIVNAISRDSVGRRRFPLIAAYALPSKLKLEAALDELRELKQELLSFLNEMMESPGEDLNQWQEAVTQKSKSFQSNVDWSSVDSSEVSCKLRHDAVASLMSRLSDDYDALDLKSCSFLEACSFIQAGLKQFQATPPAMLVLDQEEKGLGLFFAIEGGSSFHLKRHLYGNLASLTVSDDSIPPKVSRLLKPLPGDSEGFISVDDVPSLKLRLHGTVGKKFLTATIIIILTISVLFGLFYGCSEEDDSDHLSEHEIISSGLYSTHQKWIKNATAYIEWIQPLITFVDQQSTPLNDFDLVAEALGADLDPFAVVRAGKVSTKLAQNPLKRFFDAENILELKVVYENAEQLRAALATYYKRQFSDELLKELRRQNYPQPYFLDVDFSKQPLLPDFGPGLVDQLKSCITSRNALNELVLSTKAFGNSIIKPLHEICPEHAKYVQYYVRNLIRESPSLKEFQSKYTALLETFGYPKFIQIDAINVSELSENADWIHLLEQEKSVELLHKLVEFLEASQKDQSSSPKIDTVEEPLGVIKQRLNTVYEPLDAPKKPLGKIEEPVVIIKESENLIEKALDDQDLRLGSDLDEWNFFLEAELKQFQTTPFFSEVKDHAEAARQRILEDTTLESNQVIQEIQKQTKELATAFDRLNVDSIKDVSALHSTYLENPKSEQHLSGYLFAEYTAANIDKGDVESVDQFSQEMSSKVSKYLADLNKTFADLKTDYFSAPTGGGNTNLDKQISEITQNPLHFEGVFGSPLEIIKNAVANNTTGIETSKDFIWYTNSLTSKGGITGEKLAVITKAFNNLDLANQTSESGDVVRQAFDKHVLKLRAANLEDLLDFYKRLANYLPKKLHTQQDQALAQITTYWSLYKTDTNTEIPPRGELEKLRDSARSSLTKQFYAGLLAKYDAVRPQSSGDILDKIRKVSGVKSVSFNKEDPKVEILFEGAGGKLIFLPVETGNGTILVQQTPLSLQQYIQLSNLCDFDTEYYLTLQDSFWPRSFEVGMGMGFSTLNQWQFRNKDVFAPINAFNKKTLPAHLNEPAQVLQMAKFFGFRLLNPQESVAFVRLADSSSANRLKFSVAEKERLESANTVQSSVYAESIMVSIEQDTWSGGINFERGDPGESQFFDVVGGSAELAYDGTDFYACGGSWLYSPLKPDEPIRVAEPRRMYVDLGIRFVLDAPGLSYNELVKKVALKILEQQESEY